MTEIIIIYKEEEKDLNNNLNTIFKEIYKKKFDDILSKISEDEVGIILKTYSKKDVTTLKEKLSQIQDEIKLSEDDLKLISQAIEIIEKDPYFGKNIYVFNHYKLSLEERMSNILEEIFNQIYSYYQKNKENIKQIFICHFGEDRNRNKVMNFLNSLINNNINDNDNKLKWLELKKAFSLQNPLFIIDGYSVGASERYPFTSSNIKKLKNIVSSYINEDKSEKNKEKLKKEIEKVLEKIEYYYEINFLYKLICHLFCFFHGDDKNWDELYDVIKRFKDRLNSLKNLDINEKDKLKRDLKDKNIYNNIIDEFNRKYIEIIKG